MEHCRRKFLLTGAAFGLAAVAPMRGSLRAEKDDKKPEAEISAPKI